MADEREATPGEPQKTGESEAAGAAPPATSAEGGSEGAAAAPEPTEPAVTPGENVRRGLALFMRAAKQTVEEMRRSIDSPATHEALAGAKRELDRVASAAARGIEGIVGRFQPPPPRYEREVPPEERGRVPEGWTASAPTSPEERGKMPDGWDASAPKPEPPKRGAGSGGSDGRSGS